MAKDSDDHGFHFNPLNDAPGERLAARLEWERTEEGHRLAPSDEQLVGSLNALLAACHDGTWGLADGAEHAQGMDIARFLQRTAQDWRLCALELRTHIQRLGGEPEEGGTPGGALHRGWLALRSALPGYNDRELLAESERTQEELMKRLVDMLQSPQLPEDLRRSLREVEQRATRRLGQIRVVRDSFSPMD